jgi:hypothetical protein
MLRNCNVSLSQQSKSSLFSQSPPENVEESHKNDDIRHNCIDFNDDDDDIDFVTPPDVYSAGKRLKRKRKRRQPQKQQRVKNNVSFRKQSINHNHNNNNVNSKKLKSNSNEKSNDS